ncbi:hypothetical protein RFI_13926 [Reticulomyxa filosa]|uniref:Uncharacterized protein n=1 Tax=Reticulomyxa filosa TaxID=46433 RepID=X6ND48_RETFI|nr:hypothetical protein RFI_13926 [Reticulomyxa filosa]|eukprot:ETO23257.1 hypothetical protein RFI_13926 [Reticulomyxa filosa]
MYKKGHSSFMFKTLQDYKSELNKKVTKTKHIQIDLKAAFISLFLFTFNSVIWSFEYGWRHSFAGGIQCFGVAWWLALVGVISLFIFLIYLFVSLFQQTRRVRNEHKQSLMYHEENNQEIDEDHESKALLNDSEANKEREKLLGMLKRETQSEFPMSSLSLTSSISTQAWNGKTNKKLKFAIVTPSPFCYYYKPSAWYWEFILILRRILVVVFTQVSPMQRFTNLCFTLFFIQLGLVAQLAVKPFQHHTLNNLEALLLTVLTMVLIVCIANDQNALNDITTLWLMSAFLTIPFLLVIYQIVHRRVCCDIGKNIKMSGYAIANKGLEFQHYRRSADKHNINASETAKPYKKFSDVQLMDNQPVPVIVWKSPKIFKTSKS